MNYLIMAFFAGLGAGAVDLVIAHPPSEDTALTLAGAISAIFLMIIIERWIQAGHH